jgi:VanZ family protein
MKLSDIRYLKIKIIIIIILFLIIIYYAGFRPFNFFQKNSVFVENASIQFKRPGLVISDNLSFKNNFTDKKIAIEMILECERKPSKNLSNILSFYNIGKKISIMNMVQWKNELIIFYYKDGKTEKVNIGGLEIAKKIYLTIVSEENQTQIYINENLILTKENTLINNYELLDNFIFILGNSSTATEQWYGRIFGLIVYNKVINKETVLSNYNYWKLNDKMKPDGQLLFYEFSNIKNSIIHNKNDIKANLIIPENFYSIKKIFLGFDADPNYNIFFRIKDMLINTIGFIPFGIIIGLFLLLFGIKKRHVYLITTFIGFIISFSIEFFQQFLYTRTSSLIDLSLNVTGTYLGVMVLFILVKKGKILLK